MDTLPTPKQAVKSKAINDWDPAKVLRIKIPQAQYNRRAFDRVMFRNCLFFVSQQWIRYARQSAQWRPISVPDWFPKQITNKYAVHVQGMKSVLEQTQPKIIYGPGTSDEGDIAASEAAQSISDVIDEEVGQKKLEGQLAIWVALVGNGFILDGYDTDESHGTRFIPHWQCPECGGVFTPDEAARGCLEHPTIPLSPAKDENGPVGEEIPLGRMSSEVASPFEIHFDMQAGTIDAAPYIYRARTYPVELLKQMFPGEKVVGDDAGIDSGMFYQSALSYITNATSSTPGNYGGSVGSVDNVPRATLYHLMHRPSPELPEGGEAYCIGTNAVWKSELTKHDDEGRPLIPLTHFMFNPVPGRVLAKTPADDLVFKQIQRNKIEAIVQLSLERMSNPTWLVPKGIGIEQISGEPAEKIWYNAFLNGLKPERIPGSEVPASAFRWIEAIDKDMQDMAGYYDIMRGQAPKGVPTLGAAQLLLERGFARFTDALNSWARGWMQVRKNRLSIWKEFVHDDRTMTILGKNSKWETKKFNSASLSGAIRVSVEEGNLAPKSKAYQQMITAQLLEAGQLDMNDPSVRHSVFSQFDASSLVEGLDIDIKDAIKEEEAFVEGFPNGLLRPRPTIDNHAVHLMQHKKKAKADEFFDFPGPMQEAFVNHILWHQQQLDQLAQAARQNDPQAMKVEADREKISMELEAIKAQKALELAHLKSKKVLDMTAFGIKKGLQAQTSGGGLNGGAKV